MKIGLIRETKTPTDSRVALSPEQMASLQQQYPHHQFVAQASPTRAFTDDEYRQAGIAVVDNVQDCDILLGIKEVDLNALLPDKHYFFFGHFAKMQAYNRPLLQTLMAKRITFTDYEYLVDDHHQRVCAFGWWAGVVGTYYTLRGYGLRHHLYTLPQPDRRFTLETLISTLSATPLPNIKVLVTGNGRVSHGAQYLLDQIGATRVDEATFLSTQEVDRLTYAVADADRLVRHTQGKTFSWEDFTQHPSDYQNDFLRWARQTDMLICGHFWAPEAPVYLSREVMLDPQMRIRFVGDITCDIRGSILSTLRASTHEEPYYDYNPVTDSEEEAFSNPNNISVMAVDTCPNALALDTSAYFGDMLMQHVLPGLLSGIHNEVVQRGTILEKGQLTPHFDYLESFAKDNA